MAKLTCVRQDTQWVIRSQDFSFTLRDTWANQKVLFIVLRALCDPETGTPLLTYQQVAEMFGYQHRQNIQNFWQEWEQSGCDLLAYLQRKRKVDPSVVAAVAEAVRKRPLATAASLCAEVRAQLGRPDLTPGNIQTALEEVSCQVIRPVLQHQWEGGTFHPKEAVVFQEALAALLSDQPSPPGSVVDDLQAMGIEPAVAAECEGIQRQQQAALAVLLNPRATLAQVSATIRLMVLALTLYFWNVPLSRLGIWLGISKGTAYQWVSGLAVALFPVIQGWIVQRVTAASVALDEKWLKIRKQWHYWFVTLDEATGLPVCMALLSTRTTWACCWVLVSLKRLGKRPRAVITDGLAGYAASMPAVFPAATHLLCLFHHQHGVTRWLRDHASHLANEVVTTVKRQMKQVVQTSDPRTVRRRLTRLADIPEAQGCGLTSWITSTTAKLPHLLPALRRNRWPRTTNAIERFFRAFQRFYQTRGGFHSVLSAKRELMLFLVMYVFTIQVGTGKAPIEHIVPDAPAMPFYQLVNDPLGVGKLANICHAKGEPIEQMARHQVSLKLESP